MLDKLKSLGQKVVTKGRQGAKKIAAGALALAAFVTAATPSFAAVNTGNADLDNVIGTLDEGATSMKVGALYVIGAVILIAIGIFGIRWIWGIFRGWMSMAK
ncbi:hypothetical protein NDK47_27550 (plasmid) [Brevibacillus ruminantium]|uniref:Uncharacterized protein n=1 Tax=Brevibacillus ruminantium TaxID=2950604 RepID=A0ABY4WQX9_9BACL|nr:hypothetical protein [Brevibacillus ruminantium]USG68558.1 hypothetical protein NDK47_27550 [Brevibacillus ruminantium]